MRILVIGQGLPFPPLSGADMRTYHLVRALAARHEVTLVAFNCGHSAPPPFPVRVLEQPWEMPPLWREMMAADPAVWQPAYEKLLKGTDEPWFVSCLQSPGMEELLRRVSREGFDLVLIHQTNMARFLPALPPHVPKVLNLHTVHSLMAQRAVQGTSGQERELALQEADRTLRFERRAASRCALCLTVSEPEAAAARTLLDIDHVQVVPNGVDTSLFVPGEAPPTRGYLLFTGRMDAAPNIEAVQSFVKNVLPLIHRQVPEACLHVVGANPEKEVLRLASDRVVVHGRTADLSRYYREAAVVVVPLLHGGGTHQKVLEAAASGKAIVSSPLGAEGLGFSPGEDLLVADSAANFAGAVVRLLRDERQRRRLGARARQACRQYDWGKVGAHFCRLLENLIKPRAFALRGPTPGYREKPAGGREGLEALNRER